jgi:hypothetical protein
VPHRTVGTALRHLWLVAAEVAPGAIGVMDRCIAYCARLHSGTLVLIQGGLGATEASMTGALIALQSWD